MQKEVPSQIKILHKIKKGLVFKYGFARTTDDGIQGDRKIKHYTNNIKNIIDHALYFRKKTKVIQ